MDVETGVYEPSREMVVTAWKKPDADGDGKEVWRERYSDSGQHMGRERVTDDQGRPVRYYAPPSGFKNFPSFDNTDNYVRVDGRGEVLRDGNGESISIKPGDVLVEYADGTRKTITDEYEQYLFAQAHNLVSTDTGSEEEAPTRDYESKTVAELKAELESRGLPTTGNKTELIGRLEEDDEE